MAKQASQQIASDKENAGTCLKGLFYNIRVGWSARPGEIRCHPVGVGPQVEVPADDLGALVNRDYRVHQLIEQEQTKSQLKLRHGKTA